MASDGQSMPTVRVGFLLLENFSMIAFTSAVEPLRLANRLAGTLLYDWVVISKDGSAVNASNEIAVSPGFSIADVENPQVPPFVDMAFVCSGLGVERQRDREVHSWLRRLERRGTTLGALCTGAHVLARAGMLDGVECTIHWESLPGFVEEFPEIPVTSDLFEVAQNRFTCSGGTAALDMMLYLIALKHGNALATKVSEQCLVDRMRNPQDRQRMPLRVRLGVHHPKLITAIEMMEANLEEPLSQEMLAKYVGLSQRQLERLFNKHLGRTPTQYYLDLRLERARHLLYQTDMPIISVALACGFVSASHFSKCYRQMYGRPPGAERTTGTAPLAGAAG